MYSNSIHNRLFQKLKLDVVQGIKHNQNLSQQLDSMYVKIGLLIQNRIALQVSLEFDISCVLIIGKL